MNSPIASIVIPAYNEGSTITRCLESILRDCRSNEFEIVVVCNGCHDDTSQRGRAFADRGVKVIDTDIASKSNALNLGDRAVSTYPRFYVDADIQLTTAAIREVVELLKNDPSILLSAPRAVVDSGQSDPWVRAYYRVWTRLPYFMESMVGSGVYAFSEEGRARFKEFPDLIADDEFARRVVSPSERKTTKGERFVISAPRTVGALLNVNTRVRAGMYELNAAFPELSANKGTNPGRTLRAIATTPSLWLDAPIYLGIMMVAKVQAHRKLSSADSKSWNRDETARQPRPT